MQSLTRYLRSAGLLAAFAATLVTAPASAAVLYEFTSNRGNFTYTSGQYITADRVVAASELDSCTVGVGTCFGAEFRPDFTGTGEYDTIAFSNQQSSIVISSYHYFALGTFAQNGLYATVVLPSNAATLRVSGFADPVNPAVPEPATWAMLILGFGLVGGALRSARRKQTAVFYA